MKFILALIVWLGFTAALASGLVLAVRGQSWWLLLLSLGVFGLAFVRYGCRTH